MPGGVPIATITSTTAGLDGPPTFVLTSSPNVVACGLGVSRIGDIVLEHIRYGSKRVHPRAIALGSSTVVCNGLAVAYEGSLCTCGDIVAVSPAQNVLVSP